MSYRRSNKIITKNNLEYCTYVVRACEEQKYRDAGIDDMLVIPEDAKLNDGTPIRGFMSTFWWILENTPEDVVFIADDDIKHFAYRLDDYTAITIDNFDNYKEVATQEIERIAQLIVDADIGMACDNPQYALYAYTQEFTFKGMPGGARWINKKALKAKCNSNDPAWSDIDLVYQELLMNRIILQPRYFHSYSIKDVNSGGTVVSQNERYRFRCAMKNKWGAYYDCNMAKNIVKINIKR